ncbi:MAG: glycosyltransferase family 39 protein [Planctomycetota bacterium]
MYRITPFFWALLGLLGIKLGFLCWIQEDSLFLYPQIDGKEYYRWALTILEGQWLQPRPFYQSPFYPYFLASLFSLFPAKVLTVALCQIFFSTATAGLLFSITQNAFGTKAAWATFFLYTLSGCLYFYEIQPLKTTLVLFCTALLFKLLQQKSSGLGTGFTLGILILLRGNTFLLLPFILLYLFWEQKITRPLFGLFLLGCFCPLSLSLVHNYQVSQEWILNTYQGGTNFYIGNHLGASGTYQPLLSGRQVPEFEEADAITLAEKMAGKKLSYREISNFWLHQSFLFFQHYPLEAIQLQFKKLGLYFWPGEFPDGLQYSFWRSRYPLYHFFVVGYGTLWILGLCGFYAMMKKSSLHKQNTRLFGLFLVGNLVSVVTFFIFNRDRLPVIIALYPLAGSAFVQFPKKWMLCCLLIGALLDRWPSNPSNSYMILGALEFQQEQWQKAEHSLRKAVETGNQPEAWDKLGELYLYQKEWIQAQGCFETAVAQNPKWDLPYFHLGYLWLNRSILLNDLRLEQKAQTFFQKSLQFSLQKDQTCAKIAHLYWEYSKKIMNPNYQEIALSFMSLAQQLNKHCPEWTIELEKMKNTHK